jgi:hypothetical protein
MPTDERSSSPSPAKIQLDSSLRVPPFLAWPTTLQENEKLDSKTKTSPPQDYDDALIQLTLSAIEKRMNKSRKDDLPVTIHHPFLASYRSGKAFVEVPEVPINQLKSVRTLKNKPNGPRLNLDHLDIHDELTFWKVDQDRTATSSASPKLETKSTTHTTTRRVTNWQMSNFCRELEVVASLAQQLVDQFVPKQYPHALLRRCWGAFDAINEVSPARTSSSLLAT